jgi:hypothetical protein
VPSKQETSSTQKSEPWAVQAPYLAQAFEKAQGALGQAQGAPKPTDFVAQFNPQQLQTFQQMLNYAGANSGLPQTSAQVGQGLATSGLNATQGALSGLQGYTPQGGTATNITAAQQYADNPAISGMVDAAMRDSVRTAREQTLPANTRAAALSGNLNSSRRAIAEGLVERGLAEKAADISSNLRGQAYQQGLGLAEQGRQFDNQSALSALMQQGALGTSAASQGVGALGSAITQQGGLFDIAQAGGLGLQAGEQAKLDNQLQQYNFATNSPFDALKNFMSIVGSNNWGQSSQGTSTTSSTPGIGSTIGGIMGGIGALLSDARAKEDIMQVGWLYDGTPVYRFRYKQGDKRVQIGLMAQDVETRVPEAVMEIDGTKYVNYDLATRGSIVH